MIYTKIITKRTDFEIQEEIRNWQEYNRNAEIVDIKFSTTWNERFNEIIYSVMIIYKK